MIICDHYLKYVHKGGPASGFRESVIGPFFSREFVNSNFFGREFVNSNLIVIVKKDFLSHEFVIFDYIFVNRERKLSEF